MPPEMNQLLSKQEARNLSRARCAITPRGQGLRNGRAIAEDLIADVSAEEENVIAQTDGLSGCLCVNLDGPPEKLAPANFEATKVRWLVPVAPEVSLFHCAGGQDVPNDVACADFSYAVDEDFMPYLLKFYVKTQTTKYIGILSACSSGERGSGPGSQMDKEGRGGRKGLDMSRPQNISNHFVEYQGTPERVHPASGAQVSSESVTILTAPSQLLRQKWFIRQLQAQAYPGASAIPLPPPAQAVGVRGQPKDWHWAAFYVCQNGYGEREMQFCF